MVYGQDDVGEEEEEENGTRERDGGEDGAALPLASTEGLVEAGGDITSGDTVQHVHNEDHHYHTSTLCGTQEANGCEGDGDSDHHHELHTGAYEDAEEHGVVVGGAEDVGVDEL